MTQSAIAPSTEDLLSPEVTRPGIAAPAVHENAAIPSKLLFGVLPIRRFIPQDVHSVLDYSNGLMVAMAGLASDRREAKIAGAVLGASVISVSLLTDYRLSLAKLISIEAHEVLDYAWGASVIAAPFVLGYKKRAPLAAMLHIATGAAAILGSMFTDYRAARGHMQSAI
ncbi:SPW repeat domain-containing protein [Sorangium sp. So ce1024]|uniref:SPW repeat domain-containing protein n=1 Tax=unclassified Sorangium TaxID=2621164 RepID=UPI003F11ED29